MKNPAKLTLPVIAMSACLGATLNAAPAFAQGPVVIVENFIGTLEIGEKTGGGLTLIDADGAQIDQSDGKIAINDQRSLQNMNCQSRKNGDIRIARGSWKLLNKKGRYKSITEFPHVKLLVPSNTHLVIQDSLLVGNIGNIGSGDIEVRHCGDVSIGDIAGAIELRISGSGDVKLGDTGAAELSISGSGDLTMGSAKDTRLSISGSGDVQARGFGNTIGKINGSGDLDVSTISGAAEFSINGSGDADIDDINGNLEYTARGSGDLYVRTLKANSVNVRLHGSGDFTTKYGRIQKLDIKAGGSSSVKVGGEIIDARLRAGGASDITVTQPSGKTDARDSAAGDIHFR